MVHRASTAGVSLHGDKPPARKGHDNGHGLLGSEHSQQKARLV